MAIISATECTIYSNITASVATILEKKLIDVVQARVTMMLNNYFLTDLDLTDTMTFNATARTIIAEGNLFTDWNFLAGDDIYIYNSYRNDGYYTIETVSEKTITLVSGSTVIDELSARSIIISVVKWPLDVKVAAAKMCAFDYDVREKTAANIKSKSLGPWSESYTDGEKDAFGYPLKITSPLMDLYYIVRAF